MKASFLEIVQHVPATTTMRELVTKVFALRGSGVPVESLHALPCDALLLHVHLWGDPELDRATGERSFFTGIRQAPACHSVGGDFLTLFAVLTPPGAVALLGGAPMDGLDPCVTLSRVTTLDVARSLERAVCAQPSVELALAEFARWLESRLSRRCVIPQAAWRVARVSSELSLAPSTKVGDAAQRQAVSQRQLERDMQRWFNVPPKQYALTAQFQRLLQVAGREETLLGAALEAGFADQAHMNRAVKRFSGMTPQQLLRAATGPVSATFRQAMTTHARVFA
ncbi:AraC family transcriptional regulator [Piscinibacter sp. HJYY11]|uniref:helix-turn-helix domain-containing protein n=1 Tax=Piscinibacter sp. HJYY11 TaxID=2801333 RepID=UPI0019202FFB|nr:AraC family transcriptional regulator [Piscinibacter sp. HJYY11]MBL0727280.1 helix-turn-helix transcriptional regulator [Piscinibacter sp. HJYY11]